MMEWFWPEGFYTLVMVGVFAIASFAFRQPIAVALAIAAIVGALVVLKLFDHKSILRAEDRDLLDLLAAHAQLGRRTRDTGLLLALNAHLWGAVFPLLKFGNAQQRVLDIADHTGGNRVVSIHFRRRGVNMDNGAVTGMLRRLAIAEPPSTRR